MRKTIYLATLCLAMLSGVFMSACKKKPLPEPSAEEVQSAYLYMFGRYLVLQQENVDINVDKTGYNKIKYNTPSSTSFVNPNLDVVYLEAWVAVDETHAVTLNVPEITGRYYTVELIDQWGQVIGNINERTYPQHPYGKFSFVLKGSNPAIPDGATKVEVTSTKTKILARVELKDSPDKAVELEHAFTIDAPAGIKIAPPIAIPDFTNKAPITVAVFDKVDEVLAACPDLMKKAPEYQATVKKVAAYVQEKPENRTKIDESIKTRALPAFLKTAQGFGTQKGGWSVTYSMGDYIDNSDIMSRAIVNYGGLWANVSSESTYFIGLTDSGKKLLSGDEVYEIRFPKEALPQNFASAFWSVTIYSIPDYHLIQNDMKRYNLNNQSKMKLNKDGSMSIWIAAAQPKNIPAENWLPSAKGKGFSLNFRMYAPKKEVLDGKWFVAPIENVTASQNKPNSQSKPK